jgi:hypothetical protein
VIADRALAIFIECGWEPKRAAIRQRAKAGIDVVETRIDQLDRDDEASQQIGDSAMGIDVGAKFVTAKEHVAAEESVAFSAARRLRIRALSSNSRSAALRRRVPRGGNYSG